MKHRHHRAMSPAELHAHLRAHHRIHGPVAPAERHGAHWSAHYGNGILLRGHEGTRSHGRPAS